MKHCSWNHCSHTVHSNLSLFARYTSRHVAYVFYGSKEGESREWSHTSGSLSRLCHCSWWGFRSVANFVKLELANIILIKNMLYFMSLYSRRNPSCSFNTTWFYQGTILWIIDSFNIPNNFISIHYKGSCIGNLDFARFDISK